ncbi:MULTISPECIES: aldose 1-epimerase [Paraburkholderia]|uniref:Aldose 1-epimerase n=1 Tax=Paraburkholderia madseniana TaxID=2599607 RepID=A0AAP5ESH5_9BURK|nr:MULTISPECIES: aldose 1-epimerase [Paraburkholderia]MCX4151172.1 aldose 1-epimerase [Paraburkholderia madseniana]MDN7154104.1 aldose 1-epimerase [Paraburkholderia sp. WS6]MDQ6412986.1 aldose 1-epimerase [Paraburkholderia madseniana]
MRDVSLNPIRPFVTEVTELTGLTWLDDPAIAKSLVTLTEGAMHVVVAPEVGGALAAYCESTPEGPLHWLRPATQAAFDQRDPLRMASFPLFPYCNRIRDARFQFNGGTVDLNGNDLRFTHALHGNAWRHPWQVGARTESSVELHFEHEPDSRQPGDWPFRYRAQQRIELVGGALRITLSAQNLGDRPMPFGMGHHPYYPRTAQTRVYAEVQAMWHADADVLPTHLGPHPAVEALRHGMSPDAFALDNNFANWSREATIAWPDEHRQLTMTADAPFDHMVVFAPANDAQLCVEPVTNTTDCFNAMGMREQVGGCVLQPGEEIAAALNWTPRRG